MTLDPNPFSGNGQFRQELKLRQGYIEIEGKSADQTAKIKIWVEVFRPVVHIEVNSDKPVSVTAAYENWRTAARELVGDCRRTRYPVLSLVGYPGKVTMYPDHVEHIGDSVLWYHRNRSDDMLVDKLVKQQELEEVKDLIPNPLENRTFGGLMKGDNMVAAGTSSGRYASTDFNSFKLRSKKANKKHTINLYLHTDQVAKLDKWKTHLNMLAAEGVKSDKNQKWWDQFWGRSHLFINTDKIDTEDKTWQVGRNFQLYRYMQACNAYGKWPTKFNGGFFTFDPNFIRNKRGVKTESPDFRTWGGGSITAQNQRLVYWSMLKNGDCDMMAPQFEFYRRTLSAAEARTQVYWGHEGCSFTEQLTNFGLPVGSTYGWVDSTCRWGRRTEGTETGIQSIGVSYQYGHQLEFSLMILEYCRFSGKDISAYMPFIESCVTFFDEHYQYRHKKSTGKSLDENGHLVIFPSRACETYVDAKNPADVIAGLNAILTRLTELEDKYVSSEKKGKYRAMLKRVPPLPKAQKDGKPFLAGAEEFRKFAVGEIPELYSVFPYGLFSVEQDNLEIARYTWTDCLRDRQKKMKEPWYQGGIFAARLGLTDDAKEVAVFKLADSGEKFPAFRQTDDWSPDHNWMGAGSIGLQEMLMQTVGDKIILLPAWPKDWDVDFKLHAPKQTVVEGVYKNGKMQQLKVTPTNRRSDVVIVGG